MSTTNLNAEGGQNNSYPPRACPFTAAGSAAPVHKLDAVAVAVGVTAGSQPPRRSWPVPTNPIRPSLRARAPALSRLSAAGTDQSHPCGRASRSQSQPAPSTQTIASATPFSSSPRKGMATASGVSTGPVLQLPSLRLRSSTFSRVRALVPRSNARYMFALGSSSCQVLNWC
jgi:hypothetical protein